MNKKILLALASVTISFAVGAVAFADAAATNTSMKKVSSTVATTTTVETPAADKSTNTESTDAQDASAGQ